MLRTNRTTHLMAPNIDEQPNKTENHENLRPSSTNVSGPLSGLQLRPKIGFNSETEVVKFERDAPPNKVRDRAGNIISSRKPLSTDDSTKATDRMKIRKTKKLILKFPTPPRGRGKSMSGKSFLDLDSSDSDSTDEEVKRPMPLRGGTPSVRGPGFFAPIREENVKSSQTKNNPETEQSFLDLDSSDSD